jgi:hypothetical protein
MFVFEPDTTPRHHQLFHMNHMLLSSCGVAQYITTPQPGCNNDSSDSEAT